MPSFNWRNVEEGFGRFPDWAAGANVWRELLAARSFSLEDPAAQL